MDSFTLDIMVTDRPVEFIYGIYEDRFMKIDFQSIWRTLLPNDIAFEKDV